MFHSDKEVNEVNQLINEIKNCTVSHVQNIVIDIITESEIKYINMGVKKIHSIYLPILDSVFKLAADSLTKEIGALNEKEKAHLKRMLFNLLKPIELHQPIKPLQIITYKELLDRIKLF
ncbi:MAG: hypothetical protein ABIH79_01155 [archaeon]